MKLQEIIVPILLAFVTVWGISYLIGGKKAIDTTQIRTGQQFSVMPNEQMCQPVNMKVDFVGDQVIQEARVTDIAGYKSTWSFSSLGAIVEGLQFKRDVGGVEGTWTTIAPLAEHQRGKGAFLVALQEATPYNFMLEHADTASIQYESSIHEVKITKIFAPSKTKYSIDVTIIIEPLTKDKPVQARIFVPGPYMPELGKNEQTAAVVLSEREALEKLQPDMTEGFAWRAPQMFGVEDRYFVNIMVQDHDHFTQRAYFRCEEDNRLTAILEGPSISEKTIWKLTFYCGPKEVHELAAVDSRLEAIMDYGWLAPISKILLYFLNLISGFIGNYGWAIIILTLLMRLAMYPFARSGEKNLRKQSEVAEKMKYLSQKYKDDAEGLRQAQAELIKKHGLSPFTGCLPLLLQVPVFIGLNYALRNSIELYHAPFLWIHDLSTRDPYYIIPAFVGITLFLSLSATSKDPRHKITMLILSCVLIGVLMNISAGLGLFISVSSLFGYLQAGIGKTIGWQGQKGV